MQIWKGGSIKKFSRCFRASAAISVASFLTEHGTQAAADGRRHPELFRYKSSAKFSKFRVFYFSALLRSIVQQRKSGWSSLKMGSHSPSSLMWHPDTFLKTEEGNTRATAVDLRPVCPAKLQWPRRKMVLNQNPELYKRVAAFISIYEFYSLQFLWKTLLFLAEPLKM